MPSISSLILVHQKQKQKQKQKQPKQHRQQERSSSSSDKIPLIAKTNTLHFTRWLCILFLLLGCFCWDFNNDNNNNNNNNSLFVNALFVTGHGGNENYNSNNQYSPLSFSTFLSTQKNDATTTSTTTAAWPFFGVDRKNASGDTETKKTNEKENNNYNNKNSSNSSNKNPRFIMNLWSRNQTKDYASNNNSSNITVSDDRIISDGTSSRRNNKKINKKDGFTDDNKKQITTTTTPATATATATAPLSSFPKMVSTSLTTTQRYCQLAIQAVRVHSVVLAISIVLKCQMERPVLSLLPANMLYFLIQTCIKAQARPKVLRIVAMELDQRLQNEIRKFNDNKESYEFGDLTKTAIRKYTGKESYEFGDLTKATIQKYTGKDSYEFGDITKTTVQKYTGKESYEFGDITKTTVQKYTGKDSYEFGDITKTTFQKILQFQPDEASDSSKILLDDEPNGVFGVFNLRKRFGSFGKDENKTTSLSSTKQQHYRFGDISRAILTKLSGQETYRFGDITRGLLLQQKLETQQQQQQQQQQTKQSTKRQEKFEKYLKDTQEELTLLEDGIKDK